MLAPSNLLIILLGKCIIGGRTVFQFLYYSRKYPNGTSTESHFYPTEYSIRLGQFPLLFIVDTDRSDHQQCYYSFLHGANDTNRYKFLFGAKILYRIIQVI